MVWCVWSVVSWSSCFVSLNLKTKPLSCKIFLSGNYLSLSLYYVCVCMYVCMNVCMYTCVFYVSFFLFLYYVTVNPLVCSKIVYICLRCCCIALLILHFISTMFLCFS